MFTIFDKIKKMFMVIYNFLHIFYDIVYIIFKKILIKSIYVYSKYKGISIHQLFI
jgi:hypothetical protein